MSSNNNTKAENVLQPVIYGVLPEQTGDEIDLSALFSKLANQWKLILGITAGGCLLAVLLALMLPKIYQPTVIVSMPPAGNIVPIIEINTLLGGNSITAPTMAKLKSKFSDRQISTINMLFGGDNAIPATPQDVFSRYFNLLRSNEMLAKYIDENQYLKKLYPHDDKSESVLLAKLFKGLSIEILEPKPAAKGGYVDNPKRVKISLKVNAEIVGVNLINGYVDYVNHKLVAIFQNNAHKIINGRVKTLSNSIVAQREKSRKQRLLTIEQMEYQNAKKIALLQEQITAALKKARANRETRIANVIEALEMAKALGVTTPSTMDIMAKKGLKNKTAGTSITVVDKQSVPLYLYGSKYLSTLIETLKNRESDGVFLDNLSELKEKIHVIENDASLAALKNRVSDDPWIEGLPGELSKIDAIKKLSPDFKNVQAYTMDSLAIVSDKSIKPRKVLIVLVGFILSSFIAVVIALIRKERSVSQ